MEKNKNNELLEKIITFNLKKEKEIYNEKVKFQIKKIDLIIGIYDKRLNEKPLLFGKREYYCELEKLEELLVSMFSNLYDMCRYQDEINKDK